MAEGKLKQLSPEGIAEVKLKEIQFRAEDSEETRRATLLTMTGIINKRYGEALKPQEGTQDVASEEPESPTANQAAVEPVESQETAEAALARYEDQYDKFPGEVQSRCSWEELSARLAAKESHYLKLATAMQDGGELVYVDEEGNPVFRDGGLEPVMKGMDYNEARTVLYGEDYKEGTPHFGYEMPNRNTGEITAIEKTTKKPFIAINDGERKSMWIESGKNPYHAYFVDYGIQAPWCNRTCLPCKSPNRGVVRLLRVKKMN